MALSDDFLYKVKSANSIESIMSSYTQLKRRGHNYVCLCPFHSEKTPSCTVYPDNQSFYCFGCGAGGDIITFVMKSENLSYIEAVRYLAEKAGIPMPEDGYDDNAIKQKQRVLEMNRKTARFFFSQLRSPQGKKGLDYILARGLTVDTIKKYGIGYAEDKWTTLTNFLRSEGYSEDEIITAGLAQRAKTGRVYDVFRNRVIFPIIDLRGNVIAFGGRLIDGEGPKYLNSSDTPVFKKSRNLFSLNFAKQSNEKRLILSEGYMDVIAVNQGGFENVVATLGTALTPEQARLMSQYAEEIIISYDSDEPGQKATYKAINLLSEVGLKTRILKIDGAKDPDEFIKKFGPTRFKLLIDNCEGAVIFEINRCRNGLDMDSDIGKVEFLGRVTKVLAQIVSPVERDVYISRVANEQGVSKQVIQTEVDYILKKQKKTDDNKQWREITNRITQKRDTINPEADKYPKEARAESGIISYIFLHPDKLSSIEQKIAPQRFVTSFNRRIYENIIEINQNNKELDLSLFNSVFSPDEMGKISEILAKSREIAINETTVLEYIDVLLSHKNTAKADDMSDDDFRAFFNNIKNNHK